MSYRNSFNEYRDMPEDHRGPYGIPHLSYLASLVRTWRVRLSESNKEILSLTARGHNATVISKEMSLSPTAVHDRIDRMRARLAANTKRHTLRIAFEAGLIEPPAEPWAAIDPEKLTPAYRNGLDILSRGYMPAQASRMLGVDPKNFMPRLYRKIFKVWGVHNIEEAIGGCYAVGAFVAGQAMQTAPLPELEPSPGVILQSEPI